MAHIPFDSVPQHSHMFGLVWFGLCARGHGYHNKLRLLVRKNNCTQPSEANLFNSVAGKRVLFKIRSLLLLLSIFLENKQIVFSGS